MKKEKIDEEENISKEYYLKLKRSNEKKKAIIVVLIFAMALMLFLMWIFYATLKNGNSCDNGSTKTNETMNNDTKKALEGVDFDELLTKYVDYNGNQSKYVVSDNNLPAWETIYWQDIPYVGELSEDGSLYIYEEGKENDKTRISNISNAVAIKQFDYDDKLYILLNNGDVYKYNLENVSKQVFTATKIDGLKNIIKFVSINSCPIKDAGCDSVDGVIDNNNFFYSKYDIVTTD